jgi:hypothetical protein
LPQLLWRAIRPARRAISLLPAMIDYLLFSLALYLSAVLPSLASRTHASVIRFRILKIRITVSFRPGNAVILIEIFNNILDGCTLTP